MINTQHLGIFPMRMQLVFFIFVVLKNRANNLELISIFN